MAEIVYGSATIEPGGMELDDESYQDECPERFRNRHLAALAVRRRRVDQSLLLVQVQSLRALRDRLGQSLGDVTPPCGRLRQVHRFPAKRFPKI